jgi:hypothetical protein
MIAFLAPLVAAVAPTVIKGIGGLFKKKKSNASSESKPATETSDDNVKQAPPKKGTIRIAKEDLGGLITKIVDSVKSKLDEQDNEPTLSRSYAPAGNTRLQKAPLATLDKTPIPSTAPFLPKGAASLPPLGNVTSL